MYLKSILCLVVINNYMFILNYEIRNITMGDSFVIAYSTRVKTIVELLENLNSSILEKNIVMYTINWLSSKFDSIATLIRTHSISHKLV